jgi:hypothetical protein
MYMQESLNDRKLIMKAIHEITRYTGSIALPGLVICV